MPERRSLTEAMMLTPDKLAFIQGGKSAVNPAPGQQEEARPERSDATTADSGKPAEERASPSKRKRSGRSPKSRDDFLSEQRPGFLVPITVRLTPATANALRRTCLERKLQRQTPSTQQGIVELALRGWLETAMSDSTP